MSCSEDIECNPTYGDVQGCGNVEEPTTPLAVYRSYNSATGTHEYRTDSSLSAGYSSEGLVFMLANDGYAGAVLFSPLAGMTGFYVPASEPQALPYLVPLYSFWNPYRGDPLYTLDPHGGSKLPCTITGHPSGPPTVDCWQGGGVMGYVGLPCGQMWASEALTTNQGVSSCDGRFHLVMQGDGNLVLYQDVPMQGSMTALWATNTWGTTGQLAELNFSGQLVLYDASNTLLYQSTPESHGGAYMVVQNDGNLVIYQPQPPYGTPAVWSTGTGGH